MQQTNEKKTRRIILIVVTILLAIIVLVGIFYVKSTHPRKQVQEEATAIAKKYADIETVDTFYWFNRKETYFTVAGKDKNNEELFVIIPKSTGNVTVLNQKDGLNEEQIRQIVKQKYNQQKITKISLGIYDKKSVWEVVTKNEDGSLNYYLLSFETGEEVSALTNI